MDHTDRLGSGPARWRPDCGTTPRSSRRGEAAPTARSRSAVARRHGTRSPDRRRTWSRRRRPGTATPSTSRRAAPARCLSRLLPVAGQPRGCQRRSPRTCSCGRIADSRLRGAVGAQDLALPHCHQREPHLSGRARRSTTPSILDATADDGQRCRHSHAARGQARRVRAAVGRLPRKQRAALVLRVFHDLSATTRSARILGCSVGAVKANFFHALRNLKGLLPTEGSDDPTSLSSMTRRVCRGSRRRPGRRRIWAAASRAATRCSPARLLGYRRSCRNPGTLAALLGPPARSHPRGGGRGELQARTVSSRGTRWAGTGCRRVALAVAGALAPARWQVGAPATGSCAPRGRPGPATSVGPGPRWAAGTIPARVVSDSSRWPRVASGSALRGRRALVPGAAERAVSELIRGCAARLACCVQGP